MSVTRDHWARHVQSGAHLRKVALAVCAADDPQPSTSGEQLPSTSSEKPKKQQQRKPLTSRVTSIAASRSRQVVSARPTASRSPQPSTSSSSLSSRVVAVASLPSTTTRSSASRPTVATTATAGSSHACVQPSRMARPSRGCKKQSDTPLPSLKVKCPVCEKPVLPRSIKKHLESDRCRRAYVVLETRSRTIKKYGATEVEYTIKVNVNVQVEPAIDHMLEMAKTKAGYKEGDRVQVVARHPSFRHDISTTMSDNVANAKALTEHVKNIISSNEDISVTGITWLVKVVNMPRGGTGSRKILNLATDVRTKKCIVQITNVDNLCAPRAIVTAMTYHTDTILGRTVTVHEKKQIRQGRWLQSELARELCERLGRDCPEDGFTLDDIRDVERLLGVQIKVVCAENMNSVIYAGEQADTVLYLYKIGNHFNVITSMAAFLGSSYYCHTCDTAYNNSKNSRAHKCKGTVVCRMCEKPAHRERHATVYCDKCNRYCYNDECVVNHSDVCAAKHKCRTCNRVVSRDKPHGCTMYKCRTCLEVVEYDKHECYIQRKVAKGGVCGCSQCTGSAIGSKNKKCTFSTHYLFFDYEAVQESGVHVPNLVKVQDFEGTTWTFNDNESFCRWLLSPDHKGYTCIAHNAKAYDAHFILRYCVENSVKPYTIYSGTKLMLLEVPSIRLKIIDSFNFVASPLSAFPKTFGLHELKKGYFPYHFNRPENFDYVGPVPAVEYYGADTMRPAARQDFLKWHGERLAENYVFDFRQEIDAYCESDVDILRRGCLELRSQFLEIANIDPFRYLTIASVCMAIYRARYLPEETVAVLKGERREQYSKRSIGWLETATADTDEVVRHALNGGEVTICGARVDGYCEETRTVYQYHGCFWHGCLKCYSPDTVNPVVRDTMGDLNNKTRERTERLRLAGYSVIEMWECDFADVLRSDRVTAAAVATATSSIVEPLNPRDAFYGGRTDASKLKVSGGNDGGRKLRYIDVVSLYPTVMYYDEYPVGHPVKIHQPPVYDKRWFGLAKCRVLAPRGLYHPVLPFRVRAKLLFPLCAVCAQERSPRDCTHSDDERAFVGTWTTTELNVAVDKGYRILQVHEVWHFDRRSDELFRGYVRDFLKIKLETSPWQKEYTTVADYAAAVKSGMNIELDVDSVEDNPGKRAVSKICLNSLWGKFGQRTDLAKTEYVTDPVRFYKVLMDEKLAVTNVLFLNDNVVQLTYKEKGRFKEDPNSVNVFVAAFTTASARLRLYAMLDRLGTDVVYYDTDSVVYIDDGHNTVQTGSMLGEWSDELPKDDYIEEWVSTGPKSYSFRTVSGSETCKIKGFTLNWSNSEKLNMTTMKMILDGEMEKSEIVYNQIARDLQRNLLVNKTVRKKFKLVYDKRRMMAERDGVIDTKPWGN